MQFCKNCSSNIFTKIIQQHKFGSVHSNRRFNSTILLQQFQQPFINGNRTMAISNPFSKGRRQSHSSSTSSASAGQSSRRRWPKPKFTKSRVIIIGVAFLIYGLNLVPDQRELFDPKHYYTNIWIRMEISPIATTVVSPFLGYLSNVNIPVFWREPIYGAYVNTFGCRMDEAAEENLRTYPTFAAFFNRALKEGIRPISNSILVSPADGTVLHYGKVENGWIEYVKDKDYEVHEFLGPISADTKDGNSLYHIVIYLDPGDYHAFHSPTKWRVIEKIHFPGFLRSVRPSNVLIHPKLFTQNERVVLSGEWKFGYFSMSAVAAFNVGDILILNEPVRNRKLHETEQFSIYDERMAFKAGDKVGEFRLGSTIVLIFEAPSDIEFCVQAGDKLRYGQSLLMQSHTY